jgi:transcription initiation factor TFIIIB Brf1 subunit/transcription initiation factor TFIIB
VLYVDKLVDASIDGLKRQRYIRHATDLIRLAKKDWLTTGRCPRAVAGAAVSLSLAAHDVKFDIEQAAAKLHVASRYVFARD